MKIYANRRKDGTKEFLGKGDFAFIFGNEEFGTAQVAHTRKEYTQKYGGYPTHSLIVEECKAKRIAEAIPFMLTKNNMSVVFKLAEDM